jgi:hypothetical protein
MADPGERFGFDFVTSLVGSGLTLLLSAGIMMYADQFRWSVTELYTMGGAAVLAVGLILGIVFVLIGWK